MLGGGEQNTILWMYSRVVSSVGRLLLRSKPIILSPAFLMANGCGMIIYLCLSIAYLTTLNSSIANWTFGCIAIWTFRCIAIWYPKSIAWWLFPNKCIIQAISNWYNNELTSSTVRAFLQPGCTCKQNGKRPIKDLKFFQTTVPVVSLLTQSLFQLSNSGRNNSRVMSRRQRTHLLTGLVIVSIFFVFSFLVKTVHHYHFLCIQEQGNQILERPDR